MRSWRRNSVSNPPDDAADKLIETVLSRGAPDNVSLIITKVT